ncbi:MAG: PKD domain-containing protein [Bacteroidota bacterium]|nr:PKD domain-containing protein [Bacteroidota bacterium]
MTKLLCIFIFLNAIVCSPLTSFSQYILNGNAVKESCNCYLLTNAQNFQSGSVWQNTKINLNDSFDFSFNVFLGCISDIKGADGIVFILQPVSTSLGTAGSGMGFAGISPSIGISLDTYQNFENNDPSFDHISIQKNGNVVHGNDLAGPIPASASSNDIKDCAWHTFRIKWDPVLDTLSTYFDGVFRLSAHTHLVRDIFNNDPMVYWGFTAATGGSFNVQKFCTSLNPGFQSGLANNETCIGTPVTFLDSSTSFTKIKNYYWDFGDGTSNTLLDPPQHNYSQPGIYQVKLTITGADGCVSDTFVKHVTIGDKPIASFHIFDTCQTLQPRMDITPSVVIGNINQWQWQLEGTPFSNAQIPDLSKVSTGNHSLQLTATSNIGCASNPVTQTFDIKDIPSVAFNTTDACINSTVLFSGQQTDNATTINNWHWNFGDGFFEGQQNTQHAYTSAGIFPVQFAATATNGCSGSVLKNIMIHAAHALAGSDTVVAVNIPFQLNGSGGTSYSWSPPNGLSNPNISNPVANVSNDIRYLLSIKTAEGCVDTASINITAFKGSAVYVPTAFTPNNDGLNDIMRPHLIGIKTFYYFTIYNRWGQKMFTTNKPNQGWDGVYKGNPIDAGSFVWVLKAVDYIGKKYDLKGSFVLLR